LEVCRCASCSWLSGRSVNGFDRKRTLNTANGRCERKVCEKSAVRAISIDDCFHLCSYLKRFIEISYLTVLLLVLTTEETTSRYPLSCSRNPFWKTGLPDIHGTSISILNSALAIGSWTTSHRVGHEMSRELGLRLSPRSHQYRPRTATLIQTANADRQPTIVPSVVL
jgi:hypothetical protein